MSLDVWIGVPGSTGARHVLAFEPEIYYLYLLPLFEDFAASGGPLIDQYGAARFGGAELAGLLALVDQARELVAAQADEFQAHWGTAIGSSVEPRHEEIWVEVDRAAFLGFIQQLRAAVLEAQASGQLLFFSGD
jgi:hypothetical protein